MKMVLCCIAYWLLQLTWGIIMNVAGIFATLFCLIFLKGKMHINGYGFITEVGGNWGGVSLGAFALCGSYNQPTKECYDIYWYHHTRMHEFGHSLQNCVFGPLFPFIVAIPSAIRYHYQNYRSKKGLQNKPYDQAIYEYTASKWGYYAINKLEGTNLKYAFKRK